MKAMLKTCVFCLFALSLISCGGGGSTPPPPPPPPPGLTVSPGSATVALGATQQFSALSGSGTAVTATWSVNGVQGGNATVGTIDGNGKYTGPTNFPSPNTPTVTAAANSLTANANVTVVYPNDNHTTQTTPIKMGTSGGDGKDFVDNGTTRTCCSGTLGALVTDGINLFVLSNNHVLFKSDQGSSTDPVQQPGLVDNQCDVSSTPPAIAFNPQGVALKPSPCSGTCTGNAPHNVDAAIAQITPGDVDTSGTILDLGSATSTKINAAPPSSTPATPAVGQMVAKSGRSTGLTCSAIGSVTTSVSVAYNSSCGGPVAFTSIFNNQIIINGGTFSASGDSGSLVVTSATTQPVGLLFAGNSTSTTANLISDVLSALPGGPMTVVGPSGPQGAVSCDPTATASSATTSVGASAATLSKEETARVTVAREKYSAQLMQDSAVNDVTIGSSLDNPEEGALVVTVRKATSVPAQLDGVRTRVVYSDMSIPVAHVDSNTGANLLSRSRAAGLMKQAGIQGVGVGISDDNPAEPAMVVYVISGTAHAEIPPVIDGLRTKVISGDRFRAFGWGKDTVKPTACKSTRQSVISNQLHR